MKTNHRGFTIEVNRTKDNDIYYSIVRQSDGEILKEEQEWYGNDSVRDVIEQLKEEVDNNPEDYDLELEEEEYKEEEDDEYEEAGEEDLKIDFKRLKRQIVEKARQTPSIPLPKLPEISEPQGIEEIEIEEIPGKETIPSASRLLKSLRIENRKLLDKTFLNKKLL